MISHDQNRSDLPDGFSSQWASTVGEEDGFALQLVRTDEEEPVLEVYRDDLHQGALSLRAPRPATVPLAAVHWLLEVAAREMPAYTADEARD